MFNAIKTLNIQYRDCIAVMVGFILGGLCLISIAPRKASIASVNVTAIMKSFIQTQINVNEAIRKENFAKFSNVFEKQLQELATSHQVVLFPSEAVVAGAPDLTESLIKGLHGEGFLP